MNLAAVAIGEEKIYDEEELILSSWKEQRGGRCFRVPLGAPE